MSKIRLKMGGVELEYEGSDDFLREELPILLDKLYALASFVSSGPRENGAGIDEGGQKGGEAGAGIANPGQIGTTSSIAADLDAKTGPDLALAAAVRLTLGLGKASFSRKELLTEMQSATSYYNKNMSSNLSTMLVAMIKNKILREVAKDTFSLSADKKRDMENRFGS